MLIKICGMRDSGNITSIVKLPIDFIGFIFYPNSSRYVGEKFSRSTIDSIPPEIKKVGVFVNAAIPEIVALQATFQFDYVQLHGDENPQFCEQLKQLQIGVIKAIRIGTSFDFSSLEAYLEYCDYFLFDTQSPAYGGSGTTFDWQIITDYQLNMPFILSGGIGIDNLEAALALHHPYLVGLDINSKIETSPAIKSVELTNSLVHAIKFQNT